VKRLIAVVLALLAVPIQPAAATPGGPYAPEYYFDQWHVPSLWRDGARGAGITIAEIDTGVDAQLGVFDGRVLPGIDFGRLGGDGRVDRDKNAYGHGTSMASIMVGRPGQFGIEGLAPDAKVLPVAIPLAGTTDASDNDRLAAAIRWSADHGAKIISMSLGGVRRPAKNPTACPAGEQQAIYHALRMGAVLFAASGNRGDGDDAVEEPSVCLGVVSVGAVDSAGQVAAFSSRQNYLTMTAPGAQIASIGHAGSPYAGSGTSQATALASAAAALVWSEFPDLTGTQLVARLLATADRAGEGHSSAYGYGTINPYRAVHATVPANAPDPVFADARPFLLRSAESAAPPPAAPAAMQRLDNPPGTFSVGSAPRLPAPHVVGGLVLAVSGLALLLALVAGGLLTRRRRRLAHVPSHAAPEPWPVPSRPDDIVWNREPRP
jgi:subtilisin family serine protease